MTVGPPNKWLKQIKSMFGDVRKTVTPGNRV